VLIDVVVVVAFILIVTISIAITDAVARFFFYFITLALCFDREGGGSALFIKKVRKKVRMRKLLLSLFCI
jgi:hypothetical protein